MNPELSLLAPRRTTSSKPKDLLSLEPQLQRLAGKSLAQGVHLVLAAHQGTACTIPEIVGYFAAHSGRELGKGAIRALKSHIQRFLYKESGPYQYIGRESSGGYAHRGQELLPYIGLQALQRLVDNKTYTKLFPPKSHGGSSSATALAVLDCIARAPCTQDQVNHQLGGLKAGRHRVNWQKALVVAGSGNTYGPDPDVYSLVTDWEGPVNNTLDMYHAALHDDDFAIEASRRAGDIGGTPDFFRPFARVVIAETLAM